MSEWDFLWDLKGKELLEAQATGGTKEDWEYIQREEDRKTQKVKWEELKYRRDSGEISREEIKKQKAKIFNKHSKVGY